MTFHGAESHAERQQRLRAAVTAALAEAKEHEGNAAHAVRDLSGDGSAIGEGLLALNATMTALVHALERQTAVMETQGRPRQ